MFFYEIFLCETIFLCVRVCCADLLRLRVCLCVVKIVFCEKSSDFFSCFVLAKFRQLGDCRMRKIAHCAQ